MSYRLPQVRPPAAPTAQRPGGSPAAPPLLHRLQLALHPGMPRSPVCVPRGRREGHSYLSPDEPRCSSAGLCGSLLESKSHGAGQGRQAGRVGGGGGGRTRIPCPDQRPRAVPAAPLRVLGPGPSQPLRLAGLLCPRPLPLSRERKQGVRLCGGRGLLLSSSPHPVSNLVSNPVKSATHAAVAGRTGAAGGRRGVRLRTAARP